MKDILCSYYTDSEDITRYMVSMLNLKNGDNVLEPSAGNGFFIDEMKKTKKKVSIDAYDLDEVAIKVLASKYSKDESIHVKKTDSLFDPDLDFYEACGGCYDKIVGNPPYGAWQDYEKRELLKKKYVGHYVKETYSLFLLRCVSVLKENGTMSFIIPDTFLFLNLHQKLRLFLLMNTKIKEILIFPSKFFPGVNFGYSNLSIITLEKTKKENALKNKLTVYQGFKNIDDFSLLHTSSLPKYIRKKNLVQEDVLNNPQHRFVLSEEKLLQGNVKMTLGDVADVATGFYSGDNVRFVRSLNKTIKGAKKYRVVDENKVFYEKTLNGIDKEEAYIPYVKSSSKTKYAKKDDEWFVRWDVQTVRFYNENKKSRFQNSSFYFKTGICIPMVKSNTINAFLMENRVFDQSIVGIFPKDEKKKYYLLGLMNSDVVNKIIHAINPTANNSANYVRQIPYKEPSDMELKWISSQVKEILMCYENKQVYEAEKIHELINKKFDEIYAS